RPMWSPTRWRQCHIGSSAWASAGGNCTGSVRATTTTPPTASRPERCARSSPPTSDRRPRRTGRSLTPTDDNPRPAPPTLDCLIVLRDGDGGRDRGAKHGRHQVGEQVDTLVDRVAAGRLMVHGGHDVALVRTREADGRRDPVVLTAVGLDRPAV